MWCLERTCERVCQPVKDCGRYLRDISIPSMRVSATQSCGVSDLRAVVRPDWLAAVFSSRQHAVGLISRLIWNLPELVDSMVTISLKAWVTGSLMDSWRYSLQVVPDVVVPVSVVVGMRLIVQLASEAALVGIASLLVWSLVGTFQRVPLDRVSSGGSGTGLDQRRRTGTTTRHHGG